MSTTSSDRIRDIAEYLNVSYDPDAELGELARTFGCDTSYLEKEPPAPAAADAALARMGDELTDRDRAQARRFAAYLAHATDD